MLQARTSSMMHSLLGGTASHLFHDVCKAVEDALRQVLQEQLDPAEVAVERAGCLVQLLQAPWHSLQRTTSSWPFTSGLRRMRAR